MTTSLQTLVSDLKGKIDIPSDFLTQAQEIKTQFPSADVNKITQDMGFEDFNLDALSAQKINTGSIKLPMLNTSKFNEFDPAQDVDNIQLGDDGKEFFRGIETKIPTDAATNAVGEEAKKMSDFIKPEAVESVAKKLESVISISTAVI